MNFLKRQYVEMMCNKLSLSYEDLTENEIELINSGYVLFEEKMEDIKILNDDIRRISIELANLKSYIEDLENDKKNNSEWGK